MNRKIGKEFRTLLKKKLRQGDKYVALKTAFKTVKFYAARQGLQVRRVVSGQSRRQRRSHASCFAGYIGHKEVLINFYTSCNKSA